MQNNDHVTGVVAFDTPAPGGYRITFAKNPEATVWNGAKGLSPIVSVAEYPAASGVYYWTLDGNFITEDGTPSGKKIPVCGETGGDGAPGPAGATPKVAICSDGYWHISPDGSATGTPPGMGWTSLNVKAVGEKGDTGDQGDAIFAANGISQTDDAVTFTLANGGGTITLPKYKSIGISFNQPGAFAKGGSHEIVYTNTGTAAPTTIRVKDLPAGWKYSVDYDNTKITITAPLAITDENGYGEATVQVGDADQVVFTYWLTVTTSGPAKNEVGAVYYQNGEAAGIVYAVNTGVPGSGKVVHLKEVHETIWCTSVDDEIQTPFDETKWNDGMMNMKDVYAFYGNSFANCPAFEYVHNLNPTGTTYASGLTGIWYLPAIYELKALYTVWNGGSGDTEVNGGRGIFNNWLTSQGGMPLIYNIGGFWKCYWSSTEQSEDSAAQLYFEDGEIYQVSNKLYSEDMVRAILAF